MTGMAFELHNIVELDSDSAYPGPLVRRIPKSVAEELENGALVAEDAALCEIRFVVESGRRLAFSLTSLCGGDLFIYRGDLVQNHVRLPVGGVYRHALDFENDAFARIRPEAFQYGAFSQNVWRVVIDGVMLFHGIDLMGCSIRPPREDEKPSRRWLAYGSSITHGFSPITRQQCYVAQTARRLGVDVLNLGLAGSCLCESSFADYLASRNDWDFTTCELGVNMRSAFAPEEFERRARYLTEKLTAGHPEKPIVLISAFTSDSDFVTEPDLPSRNTAAFRDILQTIARESSDRNVHLVEGTELLDSFAGLTCDLVHPSTEGHIRIAENLAARLRSILPLYGLRVSP